MTATALRPSAMPGVFFPALQLRRLQLIAEVHERLL